MCRTHESFVRREQCTQQAAKGRQGGVYGKYARAVPLIQRGGSRQATSRVGRKSANDRESLSGHLPLDHPSVILAECPQQTLSLPSRILDPLLFSLPLTFCVQHNRQRKYPNKPSPVIELAVLPTPLHPLQPCEKDHPRNETTTAACSARFRSGAHCSSQRTAALEYEALHHP